MSNAEKRALVSPGAFVLVEGNAGLKDLIKARRNGWSY